MLENQTFWHIQKYHNAKFVWWSFQKRLQRVLTYSKSPQNKIRVVILWTCIGLLTVNQYALTVNQYAFLKNHNTNFALWLNINYDRTCYERFWEGYDTNFALWLNFKSQPRCGWFFHWANVFDLSPNIYNIQ